MSRRKERKAARIAAAETDAAKALRLSNGRGTVRDIPFAERLRAEASGRNGYTGQLRDEPSGERNWGGYYSEGGSFHGSGEGGSWRGGRWQSGFAGGATGHSGDHSGSHTSADDFHVGPDPNADVFHCEETNEITATCPIATVPIILIPELMWETWLKLADAYDTEWIAHLVGRLGVNEKGAPAYIVEKYYFPPQTASGAHVEVPTDYVAKPGVIGAVHSHVRMGVFFSHTDIAHSNWSIEIVINAKKEYEAVARHALKCGAFAKNKSVVYLTNPIPKVPKAISEQLDGAFNKGKIAQALEQERREAAVRMRQLSYQSNKTPSQQGQLLLQAQGPAVPAVPDSIHPDDREDVEISIAEELQKQIDEQAGAGAKDGAKGATEGERLDTALEAALDSDDESTVCPDCGGKGFYWEKMPGPGTVQVSRNCKNLHCRNGRVLLV